MDTGDPKADMAKPSPAPAGGKGKKKKKTKTVMSLDQFLAVDDGYSAPKTQNWASMTENIDDDPEAGAFKFDRSTLPTAPKAAMGLTQVDLSMIPPNGPYSAYVGNLSYEASEEDLEVFFQELEIEKIRMITDGGRPRGYAYVDFLTKESLIEGLSYHDKEYMGRNIRVDLASQKDQDGRSGGFGSRPRSDEPDRTEGNWRSGPRDTPSGGDSRGGGGGFERRENRDRGYGFGGDRDGGDDRGGDRGGTWERGGASERSSFGGDRGERGGDRGGTWERGGASERDSGFGGGRDRGGGGSRDGGDRGGTWERGLNQDRDSGRSFGGDRDRGFGGDRDRGFGGDRDRGFGGDRDRGYGGDRDRGYGGDRDRGYGGDRDSGSRDSDRYGGYRGYDERDRGGYSDRRGDRDRGYGGRDRGYSFDRDRENGGRGYGGSRGQDDRYGGARRDDFNRDRPTPEGSNDAPTERPRLKLQPRSKPAEENKEDKPKSDTPSAGRASIFGSAKPVDTYAREKEIESTIHKPKPEAQHAPPAARASIFGSAKPVDTYAREKEIEAKLKSDEPARSRGRQDEEEVAVQSYEYEEYPGKRRKNSLTSLHTVPIRPAPVSRQNSSTSTHSGDESTRSPTSKDAPKIVPAPPPKDNPWGKKSITDASNNATPVSHPSAPATKNVTPERDAAPQDTKRDSPSNKEAPAPKTSAWGRGPPARSEGQRRYPGDVNNSREGSYGRGRVEAHKPKPVKERHIPKHYDEMPKFEENKGADFTMKNKFAFLPEDDNDEGNHSGEEQTNES